MAERIPYGLALSGGGARGASHVGVLKALEEGGMKPSRIAGTSAGALAAGLYASGLNSYSKASFRTFRYSVRAFKGKPPSGVLLQPYGSERSGSGHPAFCDSGR